MRESTSLRKINISLFVGIALLLCLVLYDADIARAANDWTWTRFHFSAGSSSMKGVECYYRVVYSPYMCEVFWRLKNTSNETITIPYFNFKRVYESSYGVTYVIENQLFKGILILPGKERELEDFGDQIPYSDLGWKEGMDWPKIWVK